MFYTRSSRNTHPQTPLDQQNQTPKDHLVHLLPNAAIFQRMAYHRSFSTASSELSTGRSVISFQVDARTALRLLRFTGVQHCEDERRIAFLFADRRPDRQTAI